MSFTKPDPLLHDIHDKNWMYNITNIRDTYKVLNLDDNKLEIYSNVDSTNLPMKRQNK